MKKVPRLRFRGFSEDWELCKFKGLLDEQDGIRRGPFGSALKKAFFVENSEYVVYEQQNAIYDTYETRYKISKEKFKELEKFSISEGDFIMSGAGTIGRISRVPKGVAKGVFNQALIRFRTNTEVTDSEYFIQFVRADKMQKKLTGANPGSAITNLVPMSEIKKWDILIPSKKEQILVGLFLKKLDNTITLHQRKLDQLKELKKAYLQVMFPEKDEIVPRMRFVDFEGEWELCKLGDVANRYDNLRVPITASKRISGNTPYYGANGIQDFVEGYTHDGEFILVAEDGANDLKDYPVQYVNGKVWVNNHAHVLQAKQSIANNKFLMNAIKNINIELFLVGGSRAKLNADIMMKLEINMPVKNEQIRVSEFCTQLDNIITIYQNKLNQLKSLKKSYLQNMFI
ncbi:restriction endonuclease subunit S [Enterococcus faecalis]|nr:restriction endonuclease subunit S [Enterococcus faecalis]EHV2899425.1 restriction endonuclease subunit S [Enterococcus faecalis]EIP7715957.1 restriction endonuclease subunit S [Enterococcus faecalis]EIW2100822.1 restriction endonuclease subunit S [Enterococcus faecalis]EJI7180960.1 restriction endonuclease subunit S [Enterococcus faecalis]EJJ1065812.1 restriction endonuclease subunit S [Enterococcus faecalis]